MMKPRAVLLHADLFDGTDTRLDDVTVALVMTAKDQSALQALSTVALEDLHIFTADDKARFARLIEALGEPLIH